VTTGRPLDNLLPILSTPAAPGPGTPARAETAPPLLTPDEAATRKAATADGPRYRYRLQFSKSGRSQFLGHLDLTRTLLRAMRRARVPLTYSQGFNPKPRVQFGPALSVGVESFGEYLDFETTARLEVDAMRLAIDEALPRGFDVAALRQLERGVPGLGESICAARYLVVLPDGRTTADAAEAFARRDTLTVMREKNGKTTAFPLATWMLDAAVVDERHLRVTLRLGGEGASVRVDEVLENLFGTIEGWRWLREDLAVEVGGRLVSPLLAAPRSVPVVERAAV
jgi:radical SAM-linked protein